MLKRIIAIIAAIILIIGSVFIIRGCSQPPKYEEIKARFEKLIADAEEVNVILFGEGLPTYERVSDPKTSFNIYRTNELNSDGNERLVYYYRTLDERDIYAYRDSYLVPYSYIIVSKTALSESELTALKADFPSIDGVEAPEGKKFYTEVYSNGESHSYLIPFEEKHYDFYYSSTDPTDYDYVTADSKYRSIGEIKELAATVYSNGYLQSLQAVLYDGVEVEGIIMKPRFFENNTGAASQLMQTNKKEDVMFTEHRKYLLDTAEIIKWGSSKNNVRISIDSYLPSAPDNIVNITVELERVGGEWYLKSSTF